MTDHFAVFATVRRIRDEIADVLERLKALAPEVSIDDPTPGWDELLEQRDSAIAEALVYRKKCAELATANARLRTILAEVLRGES